MSGAAKRRQKARALAASILCVVPLGFRTGLHAASLAAELPRPRTEIVLCRHGETDWNVQGRLQGLSDIPLNGVGRSQALEIAAAVKAGGASVVVASPLLRARDTAAIVADECGADLRIDARLREASLGVMEGRTAEEINATHPEVWAAWLASEPLPRQARAEPCEAVAARLEEAILEAAAAFPAGRVVVVTHGAAIPAC
ncbi:unnamed protein product [Prorocentrum cordatum]|uniref:Histidine phosphatase family protein n=1 Tax=Prorocentrum cordatum TaxID=2364126 RepID=A0ABN9UJ85_9DINO|nr:unnamed protein product [Polarella glacialis]